MFPLLDAMADELKKEAAVHPKHKEYFGKLRNEAAHLDSVVGSGKATDADKVRHRAVVEKMRILREGHESPPSWVTDFAAHAPDSSSRRSSSGNSPRPSLGWGRPSPPPNWNHSWSQHAQDAADASRRASHSSARRAVGGLAAAAVAIPAALAVGKALHNYNTRERKQESASFYGKKKHAAEEKKPRRINFEARYGGKRAVGVLGGSILGGIGGMALGHMVHPELTALGGMLGTPLGAVVGAEGGEALSHFFKKEAAKFNSGSLLDQFDTPKNDKKTANPGHLESAKMAAVTAENVKEVASRIGERFPDLKIIRSVLQAGSSTPVPLAERLKSYKYWKATGKLPSGSARGGSFRGFTPGAHDMAHVHTNEPVTLFSGGTEPGLAQALRNPRTALDHKHLIPGELELPNRGLYASEESEASKYRGRGRIPGAPAIAEITVPRKKVVGQIVPGSGRRVENEVVLPSENLMPSSIIRPFAAKTAAMFDELMKAAAKFNSGSLLDQVGRPKERVLPASAPNPTFKVKQSFATSQYSGGLGPGPLVNYASRIPPFRVSPIRKESGVSTEEKKTAGAKETVIKILKPAVEWMDEVHGSLPRMRMERIRESLHTRNKAIHELPHLRDLEKKEHEAAHHATGKDKWKTGPAEKTVDRMRFGLYSARKGLPDQIKEYREAAATTKRARTQAAVGTGALAVPAAGAMVLAAPHKETKKTAAMLDELIKLNGMAATPPSKLYQTQRVGAPKATAAPGPSIAQMAKPVGFGMPLPGTAKV